MKRPQLISSPNKKILSIYFWLFSITSYTNYSKAIFSWFLPWWKQVEEKSLSLCLKLSIGRFLLLATVRWAENWCCSCIEGTGDSEGWFCAAKLQAHPLLFFTILSAPIWLTSKSSASCCNKFKVPHLSEAITCHCFDFSVSSVFLWQQVFKSEPGNRIFWET